MIRVNPSASFAWRDGAFVWDDPVAHQQLALTPLSARLLHWCGGGRSRSELARLDPDEQAVVDRLLDAGVLVEDGGERAQLEERLQRRWGPWGSALRCHFATRTLAGTPFRDGDDDRALAAAQVAEDGGPEQLPIEPRAARILVGSTAAAMVDDDRSYWRVLEARRSVRDFAPQPLPFGLVARLLGEAAGIRERRHDPTLGEHLHRAAPAPGAIQAIELHLIARRITGLVPAVYRYSPRDAALETVAPEPSAAAQRRALAEQPWLCDAPLLLAYSVRIDALQWRYRAGRGYRDALLAAGHLSQTVLLTATALELGAVFATAVADESLEQLLELDPVEQPLLGVVAIGIAARTTT